MYFIEKKANEKYKKKYNSSKGQFSIYFEDVIITNKTLETSGERKKCNKTPKQS